MAEVANTRCSMCQSPSGIQRPQTKKGAVHTTPTAMGLEDLMTRTVAAGEIASRITRCVAHRPLSNSSIGKTREAMAPWAAVDMDLTE